MPTNYRTPGVYVEEKSTLAPSVASVATAIPAFIGYTEKAPKDELVPMRITSLLEYESYFGKGAKLSIESGSLKNSEFVLYDSIRLYYDNGGGVCYVVSVGQYEKNPNKDELIKGVEEIAKIDEVTLLLFPDAINLKTGYEEVQKAALKQCGDLGDRFAILDVPESDKKEGKVSVYADDFRSDIGNDYLMFGAAYTPCLKVSYTKEIPLEYICNEGSSQFKGEGKKDFYKGTGVFFEKNEGKGLSNQLVTILLKNDKFWNEVKSSIIEERTVYQGTTIFFDIKHSSLSEEERKALLEEIKAQNSRLDNMAIIGDVNKSEKVKFYKKTSIKATDSNTPEEKKTAINENVGRLKEKVVEAISNNDESQYKEKADYYKGTNIRFRNDNFKESLECFEEEIIIAANQEAYHQIYNKYADMASVVPPSGAIAGVMAATDYNKGVWSAPANVSLRSVRGLTQLINDDIQKDLNVPGDGGGKSINAIRAFAGKGILVWGARTLNGLSNEWRYIPVRRFFNYVEESVQKSTSWAVFSPNDANTWIKIKCQIENFLTNLWRDGALFGTKPDDAFFVKVGLGITMTEDDINNGKLIVEIGLAAIRPAEFIILRFSHKTRQ